MLRKLTKKKGQNTAEYAILIALVVGAIIAMQTYAQRGLQARTRGTSLYMKDQMGDALTSVGYSENLAETGQYEPYYQDSADRTDRDSYESKTANPTRIGMMSNSTRTREGADDLSNPTYGYDRTTYNAAIGAEGQD